MKFTHSLIGALFIILLPFAASADTNADVAAWTQETMQTTLSANYLGHKDELAKVRECFYPAAWESLKVFFQDRLQEIRQGSLVLHPYPMIAPTITQSGKCARFQCWRVEQVFKIPEMNVNVALSMLVVDVRGMSLDTPYVIQSVILTSQPY